MSVTAFRTFNHKASKFFSVLALTLLTVFAAPGVSWGAEYTVNTEADTVDHDAYDHRCADAADLCSLRAAISEVNRGLGLGDIIHLPQGTFYNTGTYPDSFNPKKDVTIIGAGAGQTTISGGTVHRIFFSVLSAGQTKPNITIKNLKITEGNSPGSGGGMYLNATKLTLINTIVSDNYSGGSGGGIDTNNLSLINSTVTGNTSLGGGGGGIHTMTLIMENSTVSNNTAEGPWGGGGLKTDGLTMSNSTVSGNSATVGPGGGIVCADTAVMKIKNSTISNNRADTTNGGGIRVHGDLELTNSTIYKNESTLGSGGGVYLFGGSVTMDNSIIANNNIDGDCAKNLGIFDSRGHNIDSGGTCNLTGTGDLPNTDPLLGALANNGGPTMTHALLPGSPAIDNGTLVMATDQRGVTRPQGNGYDIGAFEGFAPAEILTPAPGSTLTGSSATFTWNAVSGASGYFVWVGSSPGTYDIAHSGDWQTGTSQTLTGLPMDGSVVYVRIYTLVNGSYETYFNDYIYYAWNFYPATILTPSPGSTLTGSSATFTWNAVNGASGYAIWIGSSPGAYDIANSLSWQTGTSETFSGIPMDGSAVYVRIYTMINGVWESHFNDYTYTAATVPIATILTPSPGSTLTGSSATFTWNAVNGASGYAIWIGSSPGAYDIANSLSWQTGTSETFSGIPMDGSAVYVRIYTMINGVWESHFNDYTYTAFSIPPATILTPSPGSILTGGSATFTWSAVSGASGYFIWVGSSPGTYDIAHSGTWQTGTSQTLTGLPMDGSVVYVRIYTLVNGAYETYFNDYVYNAATVTPATILTPSPGSILTGGSATFTWSSVSGASGYYIWVGSSPGTYDIAHSGDWQAGTSQTLAGLPTDGSTVYVRIYTLVNGVYASYFNDYTYTAASNGAAILTPTPGSTLSGGTATFTWSAFTGSSGYYIWIGSSPGTYDIAHSVDWQTGAFQTFSGLPTDGSIVYVRIYTMINGVWESHFNDYTYTAGP